MLILIQSSLTANYRWISIVPSKDIGQEDDCNCDIASDMLYINIFLQLRFCNVQYSLPPTSTIPGELFTTEAAYPHCSQFNLLNNIRSADRQLSPFKFPNSNTTLSALQVSLISLFFLPRLLSLLSVFCGGIYSGCCGTLLLFCLFSHTFSHTFTTLVWSCDISLHWPVVAAWVVNVWLLPIVYTVLYVDLLVLWYVLMRILFTL